MKIGFFDSGLGGLLVLEAVRNYMPQYDYVYYGDTKHVPFGDRSELEVLQLTKNGVATLFAAGCQLVVLACNTASAETLRTLQDTFLPAHYPTRRILGVIIPTIEEVIDHPASQVLLMGTERTISSGKYHLELGKRNELRTKIEAVATPSLVPLIEQSDIAAATASAAKTIDSRLYRGDKIDGVILGCTHYNQLLTPLRHRFPDIHFFAQTEIVPAKLAAYLTDHPEHCRELTTHGQLRIILTAPTKYMDELVADETIQLRVLT